MNRITIASVLSAPIISDLSVNAIYDVLKNLFERADAALNMDVSIRPEFMQFANEKRHEPGLPGIAAERFGKTLSVGEASCIRSLELLNSGQTLNNVEYDTLKSVTDKYREGNFASFTRTLLSAHMVRIGLTSDAANLVNMIPTKDMDEKSKLLIIENCLSLNYVAARRDNALYPKTWNFGAALQKFKPFSENFGITIQDIDLSNILVTIPESFKERDIRFAQRYGPPGFYLMFYPALYSIADKSKDDLPQVGDAIYRMLKTFDRRLFERQIWNGAFIGALQFHRQGAFAQRDRLLRICLRDSDFWESHKPKDRLITDLKGTEIIPIMAAHFMRSTPSLLKSLDADKHVPTNQQLYDIANEMHPSSALQSMDARRKIAKQPISPGLALLRHGVHQGGHNIFHEPAKTVRQGLQGQ